MDMQNKLFQAFKIPVYHPLQICGGVVIIGKITGSQMPIDIKAEETLLWNAEFK
jgi:hypothetical protein